MAAAAAGKGTGKVPLRGGTYSGAEARKARDVPCVAAGTPPDGASAGDAGATNGAADAESAGDTPTDEAARICGACGTGGGGADFGAAAAAASSRPQLGEIALRSPRSH
eukprot:scaffold12138_cov45-Phaeocystis_antarctica.AAC.2